MLVQFSQKVSKVFNIDSYGKYFRYFLRELYINSKVTMLSNKNKVVLLVVK
jgi:hypothetical protein